MSAVSVGSASEEIPDSEVTDYARGMAQSVLALGQLLVDTYTGVSALPTPAVDVHSLISHVEHAISGLTALPEATSVDARNEDDVAADLLMLLARLNALAN